MRRHTGGCHCGRVRFEVTAPAQIEVRSSERMLTRAEPWTNLVRLTSVCFAAARLETSLEGLTAAACAAAALEAAGACVFWCDATILTL